MIKDSSIELIVLGFLCLKKLDIPCDLFYGYN
jgi:hypothetical protein